MDHAELRAELERLEQKAQGTQDPDILRALNGRIAQIRAELPAETAPPGPKTPNPVEPSSESSSDSGPPPQPTPAQQAEAENLLREAHVAKIRGDKRTAEELLGRAMQTAPGSVSVLMAVGDDFMARGQAAKARDAYGQAKAIDPENPNVERKYAEAVLRAAGGGLSLDDQMRMGLAADGLPADRAASLPAATLLSILLPGLGHIVIGRPWTGAAILVVWLAMILWAAFMPNGLGSLWIVLAGRSSQINGMLFVALFVAAVVHLGAVGQLAGMTKRVSAKPRKDHPTPPVNMPYE